MTESLTTQERQEVEQDLAETRERLAVLCATHPITASARERWLQTRERCEREIERLEGLLAGETA